MCGLVGLSLAEPQSWAERAVREMTRRLAHRGPDADGMATIPGERVWLGFRRLAIRDLDPRANQPMTSADGSTQIVFNGEIYNSADLAARFCPEAVRRTTGDTEVLLETWVRWGEEILRHLNGMFAFAAVDNVRRTVTLVRDRFGKKPLYLFEQPGCVAFASELRSLDVLGIEPEPSQAAWYFQFGYFPSPQTFFRHVTQVCPGEVVVVRDGRVVSRRRYFDFSEWNWGSERTLDGAELQRRLRDAVRLRMISDVPVGAFLSGGVDSSLVAALVSDREEGAARLPTFTVALESRSLNEAAHARRISRQLGLEHTIIPLPNVQVGELFDEYLDAYEQPYFDSSGMAALLLCRAVRSHVTVALSGDGGDEFFCGYQRYHWLRRLLALQRVPRMLRDGAGRLLAAAAPRRGERLRRWLAARDPAGLYAEIIRPWTADTPAVLLPEASSRLPEAAAFVRDRFARFRGDPLTAAAAFDAGCYIPDDLQVKLDRASMHYGLEVRCPLLDPRVARLGAELDSGVKLRHGLKTVLRLMLGRYLPPPMFERQKQGFTVPLAGWLRGPLSEQVEELVLRGDLAESGWFDRRAAFQVVAEFRGGRDDRAGCVWMLLVLGGMLARHRGRAAADLEPLRMRARAA